MPIATLFAQLRRPSLQALIVTLAYVGAAWVGLRVLRTSSSVGLIWPATGLLVGALLVLRHIPSGVLCLAAWAASAALQVGLAVPPVVAVGLSGLGVLESLVIVWVLSRCSAEVRQLTTPASLVVLTAVGTAGAALGAVPGAIVVAWSSPHPLRIADAWLVWTCGHAIGVLLFTPLWIVWNRADAVWSRPSSPARVAEAVIAFATLLSVTAVVFFDGVAGVRAPRLLSLPHQVLPVAVWIAVRFGPRGTSIGIAAASLVAVAGMSVGGGAMRITHVALEERALMIQGFVVALTFGCMLLAIAVEQLRRQEYEGRMLNVALAEANAELMHEVGERERAALALRMLLDATPEGIVVVDERGTIVEVNDALERMFRYTRVQLIGQPDEMLVTDEERPTIASYRRQYAESPQRMHTRTPGPDLQARRGDGSTFPAQVTLSPYHQGDALRIIAAVRDVSDQRAAERQMETSLREKEVLLREVHHRVKNNMAVMSSLFYLQSRHASDPETVRVFRESESRVRSMAMVHEVLYRSSDLSAVDFSRYLESLVDHLANVYRGTVPGLEIERDIQPIRLSIEQAVPCGLLLNEVLTNAFKHAFVDDGPAVLRVEARTWNGDVRIDVVDNGIGVPAQRSPERVQTLGLRLMQALTEQLDGVLTSERQARGTRTSLAFPLVVGRPAPGPAATHTPATVIA